MSKKKKEAAENKSLNFSFRKIFPWFVLYFLAASILNTAGLFPPKAVQYIVALSKFMITAALAAIGLSADFRKMLKTGVKPIILGLIVWFSVAVTALILV